MNISRRFDVSYIQQNHLEVDLLLYKTLCKALEENEMQAGLSVLEEISSYVIGTKIPRSISAKSLRLSRHRKGAYWTLNIFASF